MREMSDSQEQYNIQHQHIKIDQKGKKLNLNENPISRLSIVKVGKKSYLLPHHIEAAKRFSFLMERANLRSNITMNYNEGQLSGTKGSATSKSEITDMAIDARKKINDLLSNLPSDCASIIIDICGFEKGLQLCESERGWPRRSAKLVLRIGLEQLAQNFGLTQKAVGTYGSKNHHWLEESSRPTRFE